MNYESFKQEMASEQKMNMNYDMPAAGAEGGMPMGGMSQEGCCMGGMPMGGMPMGGAMSMGGCCQPIYECPRENVCHRYICYEVPQDC